MILAFLSNSASNASGAGEGENEGKGRRVGSSSEGYVWGGLLTSETFLTAAGEKSTSCNSARIAEDIDFSPDGPWPPDEEGKRPAAAICQTNVREETLPRKLDQRTQLAFLSPKLPPLDLLVPPPCSSHHRFTDGCELLLEEGLLGLGASSELLALHFGGYEGTVSGEVVCVSAYKGQQIAARARSVRGVAW